MIDRTTPSAGASPSPGDASPPPPSEEAIIEAIKTVFDPEIPVNVYEIGLIYAVEPRQDGRVSIKMTLTSPGCPSAQELPEMVRQAVLTLPGVSDCDVEVVWDPVWNPSMMSDVARLQLGFF